MSVSTKTAEHLRTVLKSSKECDPEHVMTLYDKWAAEYEKDVNAVSYQGPNLAMDLISSKFSGSPEEAQVLDVACGPGQMAKLMSELGFKHFVGVDCSKGMLEEAAKTGLYEDLKQATLGTDPLPAQADTFDVVVMVGALQPNLVPFSVLRELCHVAKPGGLICLTKTQHRTDPEGFMASLERELQLLEDEGLWTRVGFKKSDRYIKDSNLLGREDVQDEIFLVGNVYLYRKPLI